VNGYRPHLYVVAGFVVVLLLAGSAHAASGSPSSPGVPPEAAAPTDPPMWKVDASTPAGWMSLTSPWLRYSVLLPSDWSFMSHVVPADSRTPHDVFAGTAGDPDETSMLVIGYRDAVLPPRADARRVVVDGVAFTESPAVDAGDGRIAIVAEGIKDGRTWYLTAAMPDDAGARALFERILATFRVPDAVAP
jgi:hypothetical protein